MRMIYHLSLGSNQGDRRENMGRAVDCLSTLGRVLARSSIYETAPLEMEGAPDFYNQCTALETDIEPAELLARLKAIETSLGRVLQGSHLKPRPIDLDILLVGDRIVKTPQLTIPHPRLTERAFVLVPLLEIAPDLVHPVSGRLLAAYLDEIDSGQRVQKIDLKPAPLVR